MQISSTFLVGCLGFGFF